MKDHQFLGLSILFPHPNLLNWIFCVKNNFLFYLNTAYNFFLKYLRKGTYDCHMKCAALSYFLCEPIPISPSESSPIHLEVSFGHHRLKVSVRKWC